MSVLPVGFCAPGAAVGAPAFPDAGAVPAAGEPAAPDAAGAAPSVLIDTMLERNIGRATFFPFTSVSTVRMPLSRSIFVTVAVTVRVASCSFTAISTRSPTEPHHEPEASLTCCWPALPDWGSGARAGASASETARSVVAIMDGWGSGGAC